MQNLKESARRFCDAHPTCSDCPLGKGISGENDACLVYLIREISQDPEQVIGAVMRWAKENPTDPKTAADVFFEKFPNAKRFVVNGHMVPGFCRQDFEPVKCCDNCYACWRQPVPDAAEKPASPSCAQKKE